MKIKDKILEIINDYFEGTESEDYLERCAYEISELIKFSNTSEEAR